MAHRKRIYPHFTWEPDEFHVITARGNSSYFNAENWEDHPMIQLYRERGEEFVVYQIVAEERHGND